MNSLIDDATEQCASSVQLHNSEFLLATQQLQKENSSQSPGAETHVPQSVSEFPHLTRKGGVCSLPTYLPSGSAGACGAGLGA